MVLATTHHTEGTQVAAQQADVVIVGGGIAGGSLATVLARRGLEVVVLERDLAYRDRNKGENMMPWGWAEVARLGLTDCFEQACGFPNPNWIVTDPSGGSNVVPVGQLRPDAPGTFSVGHVAARRALSAAATRAGADVRFGACRIAIDADDDGGVEVSWEEDGRAHQVRAGLLVGADGRGSRTRRLAGLQLERGPRTHWIASLLVAGTELDADLRVAVAGERLMLGVPLPEQQARLYLVSRDDRFTGETDAMRMLRSCREMPGASDWIGDATPAGPCATYGGEDTWVDTPATDSIVLIGDAAGHNSPIIGQGLSMAMRDVRLVSDLLDEGSSPWSELFQPYVEERRERLRRVRFVAQLWAELRLRPDDQLLDFAEHPDLMALLLGIYTGFDDAPAEWFTSRNREQLLNRSPEPRAAVSV